jgi:hypothetical protein
VIALLFFVGRQAADHVVEVNEMPVKLGSVDAYEFGFIPDRYAAPAAHAGTIDHDGIE